MASQQDLNRLRSFIGEAERIAGRHLTKAAREMLIIPIEELIDSGYEVDWDSARDSIIQVVSKAGPSDNGGTKGGSHNARSIIAGFHFAYCNIPPFCGPVRRR